MASVGMVRPMPSSPISVDLYARKSSVDAGRSVARQERAWRSDCAEEGLTPGRVFVDPNFSASRYAKKARPDYAALIEHIKTRQCEAVALWEVTRGSRQMSEWVHFLDLCRDMGVLIRVFGDDPQTYDPRRQRDRESLMKDGMAAEAEIEKLRSRTRAGTADAAAQGRPPGPLPDGYRRVYGAPTDDSLSVSGARRREITQVVDEPRAEIYRAVAEGILAGVPANFIARVLTAFEVPTATGRGRWAGNMLVKAVMNPAMEGHRVHDGQVVARDAWPPIIAPDTAAKLRRMIGASRAQRNSADTRLRHFLSGALLCALCQRPMQGHTRGAEGTPGRRRRYECEPRRGGCSRLSGPIDPIDEIVSLMVVSRLRQPDALAVFQPSGEDIRTREAQAALDALVSRRDELYAEAAKPGGPSMALVAAAERELLPRIDAAGRRVRSLQTPPALRGFDPADLADRWDQYPVGERRAVVAGLAEVVLAPVGRGGTWSPWRLSESRWRDRPGTWGDAWRAHGVPL